MLRCGLLGRKLGHSYSPQIHRELSCYEYKLYEKEPEELEAFLKLSLIHIFHELSHLPVVVDPSHATGLARLVTPMALAATAGGADAVSYTHLVKNGPSYSALGFGGEGFCTFTIASRTGEGLTSASTFTKRRRCVMTDSLCIR